ncbi:MAG: nucleotidyl transferase AbiEii/AbiGii toxin family protein [Gammaproteobacteria bacterium]|nr:nucleotidyl transferase AbiEii/AbiGii toxin family protein [Gammaproteobacteria bacterium]
MISKAFIDHWGQLAPWRFNEFIEQDLILTRLLIQLYSNKAIAHSLVFRGGTALHKLFLNKPLRYSEDLDFVQIKAGKIGSILSEIRDTINPIFTDKPKYEIHEGRAILNYRYKAEYDPNPQMKIKIEINTREHFAVDAIHHKTLECKSPWFGGNAKITTYSVEEILATKLRALYQRRKGRDLFDLIIAHSLAPNYKKIVNIFKTYVKTENNHITRPQFEQNLHEKLQHPRFQIDLRDLLERNLNYDIEKDALDFKERYLAHF